MINNKRNSFIALVLSFVSLNLSAQTPNISGVWVLKERQNIAGPAYTNGVPKQMNIVWSKDSIMLSRSYDGGTDNNSYTINESLALNGVPTEVLRTSSKRTSEFKKSEDANAFAIEVNYQDIKTGKQTSANFVENWKLSGKELVIEKNATDPDGSTWIMKGIYELKSADELKKEQATGKGVQFAENLSWEQIKEQAKRENKYIFVDCFATWCVPCKRMEKEIFPLNMVGAEMNDKFISVRVQMDSTAKDNNTVRGWYATANELRTKYNLVGYPTFLFFDRDGNIVHKGLGSYKADEFIELLKEATSPGKQYYTLLNNYNAGNKDSEKMYNLVLAAKKLGETKEAEKVLVSYKNDYLNRLPLDSLLSEKYLKLALEFQPLLIREDGSKGIFFKLLYEKGKEVDGILGQPGFSLYHVNGIITTEEISNKVYDKGKPITNPQWEKIKQAIKTKYPKLDAQQLTLSSQVIFYQKTKDWRNQIKVIVEMADKYGPLSLGLPDGSGSDNTITNALLPHCDDKEILNKAIGWMEQIIHSTAYKYPVAMVYGNYGGILYKAGRRDEGIAAFEKHLNAIGYKTPSDLEKDPRFKPKVETLNKMKRGEKIDGTWKIDAFF